MSLLPIRIGDMKRCSKCKKYKDMATEFHRDRAQSDGLDGRCKDCRKKVWRKYQGPEDRFWKQFWPRTERAGDCLIWKGAMKRNQPVCRHGGKGSVSVRRIVYRLACGDLPDDMLVIMTCKTKGCVSQYHMKKGTGEDREVKFRNSAARGDLHGLRLHPEKVLRGECQAQAKLTEADVRAIREQYVPKKVSRGTLAVRFGVGKSTIARVIKGETWRHVDSDAIAQETP